MPSNDYNEVYAELSEHLLANIFTVQSRNSARNFAREGAKLVRRNESRVPEFYKHEFLGLFKKQFLQRATEGMNLVDQALTDAKMDAQMGTVELSARLETASAASDEVEQHQVWKERERRQAAVDNKIQEARDLTQLYSYRLDAFNRLASALGVRLS